MAARRRSYWPCRGTLAQPAGIDRRGQLDRGRGTDDPPRPSRTGTAPRHRTTVIRRGRAAPRGGRTEAGQAPARPDPRPVRSGNEPSRHRGLLEPQTDSTGTRTRGERRRSGSPSATQRDTPHAGLPGLARGPPEIETRAIGLLHRPASIVGVHATGSPQVTPRATPCTGCERFVTESGIGPIRSNRPGSRRSSGSPECTPMRSPTRFGGAPATVGQAHCPGRLVGIHPAPGSRRTQRVPRRPGQRTWGPRSQPDRTQRAG